MGLFDFLDTKEKRKDKRGNEYTYNLTTGEIKKDNGVHKYRVGSANNTNEFKKKVDSGQFN